eukprot:SAG31_NODE_2791_length_5085_cov_2.671480_4_plen_165_part_00
MPRAAARARAARLACRRLGRRQVELDCAWLRHRCVLLVRSRRAVRRRYRPSPRRAQRLRAQGERAERGHHVGAQALSDGGPAGPVQCHWQSGASPAAAAARYARRYLLNLGTYLDRYDGGYVPYLAPKFRYAARYGRTRTRVPYPLRREGMLWRRPTIIIRIAF